MTDVLLSTLHFLLTFSLVRILAVQYVLIRPGITTSGIRLAARLERVYGVSALLLLGVGFAHVYWDIQSSSFYLSNLLFWAKIGLFTTIAVLSTPPTDHIFHMHDGYVQKELYYC